MDQNTKDIWQLFFTYDIKNATQTTAQYQKELFNLQLEKRNKEVSDNKFYSSIINLLRKSNLYYEQKKYSDGLNSLLLARFLIFNSYDKIYSGDVRLKVVELEKQVNNNIQAFINDTNIYNNCCEYLSNLIDNIKKFSINIKEIEGDLTNLTINDKLVAFRQCIPNKPNDLIFKIGKIYTVINFYSISKRNTSILVESEKGIVPIDRKQLNSIFFKIVHPILDDYYFFLKILFHPNLSDILTGNSEELKKLFSTALVNTKTKIEFFETPFLDAALNKEREYQKYMVSETEKSEKQNLKYFKAFLIVITIVLIIVILFFLLYKTKKENTIENKDVLNQIPELKINTNDTNSLNHGISYFETWLKQRDSLNAPGLDFLGTLHYWKKDYEKSLYFFNKALSLDPDKELKANIYAHIGLANLCLGKYNDALFYGQKAEKIKTTYEIDTSKKNSAIYNIYILLAETYLFGFGNDKLAKIYFEKILKIKPDDPEALAGYATIYRDLGDLNKAEELSKQSLEKAKFPIAIFTLAYVYSQKGDSTLSKEMYEKGIEYQPNAAQLYYESALHYDSLGNKKRVLVNMKISAALGYEKAKLSIK